MVATLLSAHQSRSEQLATLYADADGARKDEVDSMTGDQMFDAYYSKLGSIREYHRKFPTEPSTESAETMLISGILETAPE